MQLVKGIGEIKTVLEPEFWLVKCSLFQLSCWGVIIHKEKKQTPLYYELGQA